MIRLHSSHAAALPFVLDDARLPNRLRSPEAYHAPPSARLVSLCPRRPPASCRSVRLAIPRCATNRRVQWRVR